MRDAGLEVDPGLRGIETLPQLDGRAAVATDVEERPRDAVVAADDRLFVVKVVSESEDLPCEACQRV